MLRKARKEIAATGRLLTQAINLTLSITDKLEKKIDKEADDDLKFY